MKYLFFIIAVFLSLSLQAGEIEPRSYVDTPVGVNFMLAGYVYSDGGLSTAAASPIQDAQLKMGTEILAYARSLNVMGKSAKFDMIVPYSDLSGSALVAGQPRERNVEGLNDPRFRFSMNFYGAPALSLDEFTKYQQDLIIGASVQVSAPLGQYDDTRLVNLGNNRWFVKPDIGISKAWGDLALELSSGIYLFTNNEDYFGGKTLEQDPLYTTQLHFTYNFTRGAWVALSATTDNGGRTKVNGVWSDDLQENSRVGATLAVSLNKNNSIKIYGSNSIHTRAGSDYSMIGAIWQHRWGGGL